MTDMSIVPTQGITNPGLPPKTLVNYVRKENAEALPPPASLAGWQGWMRENLFSSPLNIAMTIISALLVYWIFAPLIGFTLVNAVWSGSDREACIITEARPVVGACWPFVFERFEYFVYGSYPVAERWRPTLFFVLLITSILWLLARGRQERAAWITVGALVAVWAIAIVMGWAGRNASLFLLLTAAAAGAVLWTGGPRKDWAAIFAFVVTPLLSWWLLSGGWGLPQVQTNLWGGILISLIVAAFGIVFSLPFGVLLALGRRSKMPAVKLFSVILIEFVRGVPFITVLFMASNMLPLFVPEQYAPDKLLRALIAAVIFASAYMAEVVRAGLQALPKGQYEGAMAMGLGYWQMMRLIILPQALKVTIPNIVNTYIGLFKDTTLVVVVGLFDFLKTIEAARIDPKWAAPTTSATGYMFAAIFYFICCYAMSLYAKATEERLAKTDRR
jgi:general L-amino acid transport system permease protein